MTRYENLSQDVLYCFTDYVNDYVKPDNVLFLKFWETFQYILGVLKKL